MMHASATMLALAASLTGCATANGQEKANAAEMACEQDFLALTGRVVDQAALLPPESETRLTQKLELLEDATGHQFVIAMTVSLQGKSVDDYTICLARHWGIGRKDIDDGVVLLIAPVERRARIEVGGGLEASLTNAEAGQIMQDDIIPPFKAGDYLRGIEAGADAIIKEIG